MMRIPPRLVRQVVLSGIIFWLVSVAAFHYIRLVQSDVLRILIALAPAIPGVFFVITIGVAISRLDEMQRRIQIEALAISFAGTALVSLCYGLLGQAGFRQANWVFVLLVMVFFWGVGKLWTLRRYR